MKYLALIAAVLGFTAAPLTTTGLCADPKPAPPKEALTEPMDAWLRRVPKLNWDDETPLRHVLGILKESFPEVNFIAPEGARDTPVSGLVLRSVSLEETLKAIELASEGRIRANYQRDQPANIVGFLVARAPTREVPVVCRVFSLVPYLESHREKDVPTAIKSLYEVLEIAWDMQRQKERDIQAPTLNIHEGTKLLIAVGREKELAVIEQVVKELQGGTVSVTKVPGAVEPKVKTETLKQKSEPTKPAPKEAKE